MLSVCFIVPVRNDADGLRRCLTSIAAIDYPRDRFEIVVADNGSVDDSREVAARAGAVVMSVPGVRVAELRNRAAASTRSDVIVFIDADHELSPHWLRSAIDVLQRPSVAVAGATYVAPPDGTWVQRGYDALRNHTRGRADVEWVASGTMAMWRRAFDDVCGFDTSLDTCEDVDLCRRVRAAGLRVVSDDRLATPHFGDPSTLRAVFVSELWRGRDNLRASLRGPLTLRSLPSIAIPLIDLTCLIAAVAALVGLIEPVLFITAAAATGVAALAALRPARMVWRDNAGGVASVAQAMVISVAHDVARALALVIRMPHRRADPTASQTAVRT